MLHAAATFLALVSCVLNYKHWSAATTAHVAHVMFKIFQLWRTMACEIRPRTKVNSYEFPYGHLAVRTSLRRLIGQKPTLSGLSHHPKAATDSERQ